MTRSRVRARELAGRAAALRIGGHERPAADRGTFPTRDPSTGELVAEVANAAPADVEDAVRVARRAIEHGAWAGASGAERAAVLRRAADLLEAEAESLALVEALDAGRPVGRALGSDVPLVAAALRANAALAEGHAREVEGPAGTVRVREPAGVVGVITPWNLPVLLTGWHLAPPLAAGCAVLLKPSERAPLSASLLADILIRSGVPAESLAVLPGRGERAGAAIAAHPDVDRVTFTGSTAAGRVVGAACGSALTEVSLELGGKNACVILADADLDVAAAGAAVAAFANGGQACTAGSIVLVEHPIADDFTERFATAAARIRIGDALDARTEMGPLISPDHVSRVRAHVGRAVREGARVRVDVAVPADAPRGGSFMGPVVLDAVPEDSACLREELFGPVACVVPFRTPEQALARARATRYGLAGGVWTGDGDRARWFADRLGVGTTWINGWHRYDPRVPLRGRGDSGSGGYNGPEPFLANVRERVIWPG